MSEIVETRIGKLPRDWQVQPLAETTIKIQDGTHFSPQSTEGPRRYLTSKNVRFGRLDLTDSGWISQKEHDAIYSRCDVKYGDVLLTKDGANTGNACLNNEHEPFSLLSSVAILRTDGVTHHAGFILQYILSPLGQRRLKDLMSGNAITRLTLQKIKAFETPVPHASEQRRIAEVLSTLDQTIEQTQALIAKYQQIKVGLMHDLFTRGVTRDGHVRPTREQAPDLYKASELGWIPKEWEIVSAEKLCPMITKGATPAHLTAQDNSSSVPFIRVQNLTFDGSLVFDEDQAFISPTVSRAELSRSRVLPGDILMNIVGPPLGKVSVTPDTYPEWNINQAIAIFRPILASARVYLTFFLLSDIAQRWFLGRAKRTSGQVNLTLEMCRQLPIPKPREQEELKRITWALASADRRINSERRYLEKLIEQKHGLMQDLLTGRVRVRVEESEDS